MPRHLEIGPGWTPGVSGPYGGDPCGVHTTGMGHGACSGGLTPTVSDRGSCRAIVGVG